MKINKRRRRRASKTRCQVEMVWYQIMLRSSPYSKLDDSIAVYRFARITRYNASLSRSMCALTHAQYPRTHTYTHVHACMHTQMHNVCTHTCITHMHIHTYTEPHAHIHTCMTYIHTYTHIHVHTHACMCNMYVWESWMGMTLLRAFVYLCVHACIHSNMHISPHACVRAHTYAQKCTQA